VKHRRTDAECTSSSKVARLTTFSAHLVLLQQFYAAGWEGDIREGHFFAGLPVRPGEDPGEVIVGLKQDNNGTTFIWSPFELSWLADYEANYVPTSGTLPAPGTWCFVTSCRCCGGRSLGCSCADPPEFANPTGEMRQ
jgi:hypothetical protein